MDILLYTNNSDSNVLNKDIVFQKQIVCYANKENIDINAANIEDIQNAYQGFAK